MPNGIAMGGRFDIGGPNGWFAMYIDPDLKATWQTTHRAHQYPMPQAPFVPNMFRLFVTVHNSKMSLHAIYHGIPPTHACISLEACRDEFHPYPNQFGESHAKTMTFEKQPCIASSDKFEVDLLEVTFPNP